MSRFAIYTVYLLCRGFSNGDGRHSTPLTETLYCTSTRRTSSRYTGETGTRKPPTTMLMPRACARTLGPRSLLLLEHSFQPTPSPLYGPALWPLLGAYSMYPGE